MRIEHVRSHTGVRGNEAADVLARRGTQKATATESWSSEARSRRARRGDT